MSKLMCIEMFICEMTIRLRKMENKGDGKTPDAIKVNNSLMSAMNELYRVHRAYDSLKRDSELTLQDFCEMKLSNKWE